MFKPGDVVRKRDGGRFITVTGTPHKATVREVAGGKVYLVDGMWTIPEMLVLVTSGSVADGCIPFPPKRDKNNPRKARPYYAPYVLV